MDLGVSIMIIKSHRGRQSFAASITGSKSIYILVQGNSYGAAVLADSDERVARWWGWSEAIFRKVGVGVHPWLMVLQYRIAFAIV